jgi:phytoene dehydrogenase-like protein
MSAAVVIVGSGINSLVCGAELARAGKRVLILERNDRLGGCIRTEELFDGYTHDVLSGWYPLFLASPAFESLGPDLRREGVEFLNTERPTGVVTPGGDSLVLTTDDQANVETLNRLQPGEGDRYAAAMGRFLAENSELVFGMLGSELWSRQAGRLLWKESRRRGGVRQLTAFLGGALEPARAWLERDFDHELTRALIAPWVLHAGLGPDDAYSGIMGKVITAALVMAGLPVVAGGSQEIVAAFERIIRSHGGEVVTGAHVAEVVVERGKAIGVRTDDGTFHGASTAVVCNVTPTQLYGHLLAAAAVPAEMTQRAASYRYGRADMQIHFALTEKPEWSVPDVADAVLIHLTSGLDAVSQAVNESERGLLPAEGTIVVGQPTVIDPSRAPDGASILWIQLQELPSRIKGDAAGEISTGPDGLWTEEVREAYADRIQERLSKHIANLDRALMGRKVFSPADLEGLNINLVGGDPYSGACTLDQFLVWRPLGGAKNHETPVRDLYHIGASTHPGPGLGGVSGLMVARGLT